MYCQSTTFSDYCQEPVTGFEPATFPLRKGCSAVKSYTGVQVLFARAAAGFNYPAVFVPDGRG